MYSFQTMQILVFLLPGFISEIILNKLIVRKDKSEWAAVVEALVFSLIIYVAYSLIISRSPVELTVVNIPSTSESSTYTIANRDFLWLLAFSVAVPLIWGALMTYDLPMKLLRRMGVTRRSGRQNVWLDVFLDKQRYVVVNFVDGRRMLGWPRYYSDDQDKQYINLERAHWMVEDQQTKEIHRIPINMDGVLITPEQKIESIMFYPVNEIENRRQVK